jgi:hypothetical protein
MYLIKHRDNFTNAAPRFEGGWCDVPHISLANIHGGVTNQATLLKCQHHQEYNAVWLRGGLQSLNMAALNVEITSRVFCDPHTTCLNVHVC